MAKYIPEAEAAMMIGVEAATLRENARCGRWNIPYHDQPKGTYRYLAASVRQMVDNPTEIIRPYVLNRWQLASRKRKLTLNHNETKSTVGAG